MDVVHMESEYSPYGEHGCCSYGERISSVWRTWMLFIWRANIVRMENMDVVHMESEYRPYGEHGCCSYGKRISSIWRTWMLFIWKANIAPMENLCERKGIFFLKIVRPGG